MPHDGAHVPLSAPVPLLGARSLFADLISLTVHTNGFYFSLFLGDTAMGLLHGPLTQRGTMPALRPAAICLFGFPVADISLDSVKHDCARC